MQTLQHEILINNDLWSSTKNSRLLQLQSHASQTSPVNVCDFSLTYPDGISVKAGDEVEVKLGMSDDTELIFTGTVEEATWHIDRVDIRAASSVRHLTAAHYNMSFERPFVGDIIEALCSEAEVETGRIDSGLPLDFYSLGDQLNGFDHIRQLALNSGFDCYTDEKDELNFVLPIPGNGHPFAYGNNILSLELSVPEEGVTGIEMYGESPASLGQGPLAAHWLTKKEVKGDAGNAAGVMKRVISPAVRNIQTATVMAQARLLKEKSKKKGRLKTWGRPDIRINDLCLITQMPASDQDGVYKVSGVHHRIHPKRGYTTILNIEELI